MADADTGGLQMLTHPSNLRKQKFEKIAANRSMIQKFAAGVQIRESCDCR